MGVTSLILQHLLGPWDMIRLRRLARPVCAPTPPPPCRRPAPQQGKETYSSQLQRTLQASTTPSILEYGMILGSARFGAIFQPLADGYLTSK
jgi:hypothetical protein